MANVSAELLWPMVRDTSCFAVKRKVPGRSGMGKAGPRFTTEPNNVSGVNSFKYSGLVNAKTVSLEEAEKGVTLVKKVRKADRLNKPNKMYNKVSLTKDFRRVARCEAPPPPHRRSAIPASFYPPPPPPVLVATQDALFHRPLLPAFTS